MKIMVPFTEMVRSRWNPGFLMFVLFQGCWFGKRGSKVCFGYIKFGRPLNVK